VADKHISKLLRKTRRAAHRDKRRRWTPAIANNDSGDAVTAWRRQAAGEGGGRRR